MSVVGGAAGGEGEGAAGCNDKNKNPTIERGEKQKNVEKTGDERVIVWFVVGSVGVLFVHERGG